MTSPTHELSSVRHAGPQVDVEGWECLPIPWVHGAAATHAGLTPRPQTPQTPAPHPTPTTNPHKGTAAELLVEAPSAPPYLLMLVPLETHVLSLGFLPAASVHIVTEMPGSKSLLERAAPQVVAKGGKAEQADLSAGPAVWVREQENAIGCNGYSFEEGRHIRLCRAAGLRTKVIGGGTSAHDAGTRSLQPGRPAGHIPPPSCNENPSPTPRRAPGC